MYLLICTIGNDTLKKPIEEMFEKNKNVVQATWLSGENIKKKSFKELPSIGGSFHSLFRNTEQEVLLARVSAKNNVEDLMSRMKKIDNEEGAMDYFVIPLVS